MMKLMMAILCVLMMSTSSYSAEFFINNPVEDLQIIKVYSNEGRMLMKDSDGNEAEVQVGDTIGSDSAIVIKIDASSITIQIDETKTRIPVKRAIGKSAG